MEVISSKSFEEDSSEQNSDINDNNIYTPKKNQNITEEEDDEEFENNLNEMEMNGINEINELDEEEEESENNIENKIEEEHYEENEISNSVENVENNTINTIDEENDENSNGLENNNINNIYGNNLINNNDNNQMPFIIPLIVFENDKYIITSQGKKLIGQIGNNKMSLISVLNSNKYQNNKINILNKLITKNINEENYYKYTNSKENKKNSIIIYSKPLMIINNNNSNNINNDYIMDEIPCYILDIINLDINNENNDSKIFLVMILISSIFLFISDDINEEAFNFFNFIINLIKTIKIRNITEEENNELNEFLPKLFWILFSSNIKLEDKNGNTITEKQYMDNNLKIINSSNDHVEEINRIKTGIRNYFVDRECFTLMNNDDIFNSNDFKDKTMKNKIYKKAKPKTFFGNVLTGNMILELIESLLNIINEGCSPIIYNSWKYMMKKEFLKYANNLLYKFASELRQYRTESINDQKFFDENHIEKYNQKILEKYLKEYMTTKIINEETKFEYKEKIKSKLESELHKYEKENEKYFEEKFIKELNLLSNKFMENFTSSDIYEKNSYKFFQDFEDFREIAVQKTPFFTKKNDILFDKVLLIIKKFINGKIMKIKVINEEKNYLDNANKTQDNKINELNKELNLIKSKNYEFIQKITNEIKIEKKKNIRIEEKMTRLINNKSKEIDNLKNEIEHQTSNYEKKIKQMLEANKNLDKDIKIKDEQITIMKMNNDKVSALYNQKSNFLEREINNWKDKYNITIKQALNKQNELTKENIKLKEQNKFLLKKDKKNSNNEIENIRIINNKNINKNINSNNNSNTNKIKHTKNNINGLMTYIKMNFKDKKNKMIKLDKYFLNKKKQSHDSLNENKKEESNNKTPNNNNNIIYSNEKQNQNQNQNSTPMDNTSNKNTDFYSTNKNSIKKFTISNSSINSYNTLNSNNNNNIANNININNNIIFSDNKYSSKTEKIRGREQKNSNMSINTINSGNETFSLNNYSSNNNNNNNNNGINKINNNYNPEKLKIKIIKGRIRKDKTGKPYLEYIINIDYDNVQNWNINRRFNQFTNLYKTLRSISQENFDLPESSNIFSNITAMFSGLSHENKIIQLEKYLKDLTEVPEISNSKQLYFFLELNHIYELNQ